MEVGLFRDWIIIVWGLLAILATISITVVVFSVYRRINVILKAVEGMADRVAEVGKPLAQVSGFVGGIVLGIRSVRKIFKKGGDDDGKL